MFSSLQKIVGVSPKTKQNKHSLASGGNDFLYIEDKKIYADKANSGITSTFEHYLSQTQR
jgi:hypothetical protein